MRRLRFIAALLLVAGLPAQASRIYVTATDDKIGGDLCSLKEAIYSAILHSSHDGVHGEAINGFDPVTHAPNIIPTDCLLGDGQDDVIVLPSFAPMTLTFVTDDDGNFMGPTATPMITTKITIEANGAHLQGGTGNFRLFAVGPTGHLIIRNAWISGFIAKGGDGAGGGGGGMGAGGAIYVRGGVVEIESSTLNQNQAVGGAGQITSDHTGGGGGMGGGGAIGDSFETGGGGGGARGDGGAGLPSSLGGNGGGGGGTLTSGLPGGPNPGAGGFNCGGDGGFDGSQQVNDGNNAATACDGGGGGGAGVPNTLPGPRLTTIYGGSGSYGGGAGGAADKGGRGGFGGGGGGSGEDGGDGGFGGGGGGGNHNAQLFGGDPGHAGMFGGEGAQHSRGGGGAGLGGAVFSDGGDVRVRNSTFAFNRSAGGRSVFDDAGDHSGRAAGAAIFALNGSTRIYNATIASNHEDTPPASGGGGLYVLQLNNTPTTVVLDNSIVAGSTTNDCALNATSISGEFTWNLIQSNDDTYPCPPANITDAPLLESALTLHQGYTPTLAIPETSPAWNKADFGTSLPIDQRGETRPQMGGYDIGAFELCLDHTGNPCTIIVGYQTVPLNVTSSSLAGGITVPSGTYAAPMNSVIVLAATPNPNYCFVNWSGNVTDPTRATTTIIMEQAQSATANFTPVVTSTVATSVLNPMINHNLVNVGLAATDNCGATATFQVAVFGDEDDQAATDKKGTVFSPDATNIGLGTLQLRAERADSGDGRVYLIVVRDTDSKGNTGFSCSSVVVPHDSSASALAAVNNQAGAARAYCQAHAGSPPPGYFVIGDGPGIGPK